MGWRYLFYTCGALVFVLSVARVLVIRFHETPKFLLCQGKDEDVIKTLRNLADQYDRPCNLTLEQLQACGQIQSAHANDKASLSEVWVHIKGLFATQQMALSTSLVWLSWAMIGLGYALYYVYLPEYLASRDASSGESSSYLTWRNYAITNLCAVPGPIIAGFMCEMPIFGRKRTMAFGAFATSKLLTRSEKVYQLIINSGVLLRLYLRPYKCPKPGILLRDLSHDQHLLCYLVRVHCRDSTLCASWNRKRCRCRTQPTDGDGFRAYRRLHFHLKLGADLCLCRLAGYVWYLGRLFPA